MWECHNYKRRSIRMTRWSLRYCIVSQDGDLKFLKNKRIFLSSKMHQITEQKPCHQSIAWWIKYLLQYVDKLQMENVFYVKSSISGWWKKNIIQMVLLLAITFYFIISFSTLTYSFSFYFTSQFYYLINHVLYILFPLICWLLWDQLSI